MVQQVDLGSTNLGDLVKLLAGGGAMAVALRIVERIFARADKRDDVATGLRAEMIRRLEAYEKEHKELRAERDQYYRSSIQYETESKQYEAENLRLRERYHEIRNWIQLHPQLDPPTWLFERVGGPTEGKQAKGLPREHPGTETRSRGKRRADSPAFPLQEADPGGSDVV